MLLAYDVVSRPWDHKRIICMYDWKAIRENMKTKDFKFLFFFSKSPRHSPIFSPAHSMSFRGSQVQEGMKEKDSLGLVTPPVQSPELGMVGWHESCKGSRSTGGNYTEHVKVKATAVLPLCRLRVIRVIY